MAKNKKRREVKTRSDLFGFLQNQMEATYDDLLKKKKLEYEGNLVKTYLFEVDEPEDMGDSKGEKRYEEYLKYLFSVEKKDRPELSIYRTEELGFYEVVLNDRGNEFVIYIDTATNPRFWMVFSLSKSEGLDSWFNAILKNKPDFDFVWLWPDFLESFQKRGVARGFGLDYDYRVFEKSEDVDTTLYLKMQLWGGSDTADLYELLSSSEKFSSKVVLSKIRFKEFREDGILDRFALEDIKYNGKFTTRGTDFNTHLSIVESLRKSYERIILQIEEKYSLKWVSGTGEGYNLEGYALHFEPAEGQIIPIDIFYKQVFNGTEPFRLMGFVRQKSETKIVSDVVDLHTGGELTFELYPDLITLYLGEGTCGNSIARFFTNIQHYFDKSFSVYADNGDRLFTL